MPGFNPNRRQFLVASGAAATVAGMTGVGHENGRVAASVIDLRVDNIDTPLGLESRSPAFSWRIASKEPNLRQGSYRICAASSNSLVERGIPDLWDSGRISSSLTFGIGYPGRGLKSRQRVYWRVEAWDTHGNAMQTSPVSWWEMGLLEADDWQAQWVAAEDSLSRGDREAGLHWIGSTAFPDAARARFRFYFSAKDSHQAVLLVAAKPRLSGIWLNGAKVQFTPFRAGPVDLGRMITVQLPVQAGGNLLALEVELRGNDVTAPSDNANIAALLRVQAPDGSLTRLTTDSTWRVCDENPAAPDWYLPRFDHNSWEHALAPSRLPPGQPWPAAPAMLLRRTFLVHENPDQARLYITALGAYEAHLNGSRVGEFLLTPESTDYRRRVLYRVFDVSGSLILGENVLGAIVGDGWYASTTLLASRYSYGPPPRRLIAQLELIYGDGRREIVASDDTWRLAESPIRASEIYDGELYDARLEIHGWNSPGYDAATWSIAQTAPAPECRKVAQVGPGIRIDRLLKPLSVTHPRPGLAVFDLGQNFAGWCRLRQRAPAGTRVELRFAELLRHDGDIDQSNLRSAEACDTYIFRGDPSGEIFEPRFTYHGFRYVSVVGFTYELPIDAIEGVVISSLGTVTGRFDISEPLVQQLWQNTIWSQRSNFVGIPTDCPQRDERLGWMGDIQVFCDAAAFNADIDAFLRRFTGDIRDAQRDNGAFTDFAPTSLTGSEASGAPGWADAGVILPWTLWQRYGDRQVIDENWAAMERYSSFVLHNNPEYIWTKVRGEDYGDWLALDAKQPGDETTPKDLIATSFWARATKMMAQMAEATQRVQAGRNYNELFSRIKSAFVGRFVASDGTIGNGSQTSFILALHFDLVPQKLRSAAVAHLVSDIERRGTLLSTGFLGTPYALDVLADGGHAELVFKLLTRSDYPSWGYMVRRGATTIWERWNGDVGDLSMNSFNHYALGAVVGFLYRRIAGITPDAPGFARVRIRPLLKSGFAECSASVLAVPGRISTKWTRSAQGLFNVEVEVPANVVALIHLPSDAKESSIGRRRLAMAFTGARRVTRSAEEVIVEVGSGRWSFDTRGAAAG
jgi:alpha-L-rhamnosidase